MNGLKRWMALVCAVGGLCSTAHGTVLFSNLAQVPELGFAAYGGEYDFYGSSFLTGSSAPTILSGSFSFGNPDDIAHVMTPAIYTNNGGKPGSSLGSMTSFNMPAASEIGNLDFSIYDSTTTGILLAANTQYWMVVSIDAVTDLPFYPIWNTTVSFAVDAGGQFTTVPGATLQFSDNGGNSWSSTGGRNAMFSLSGNVGSESSTPEPSNAILLASGLVVMVLRSMRRR